MKLNPKSGINNGAGQSRPEFFDQTICLELKYKLPAFYRHHNANSHLVERQQRKIESLWFTFKMTLGVLSLGFLLALPSGILAWFDGLPWTGEAETLVLSVIIPSC